MYKVIVMVRRQFADNDLIQIRLCVAALPPVTNTLPLISGDCPFQCLFESRVISVAALARHRVEG